MYAFIWNIILLYGIYIGILPSKIHIAHLNLMAMTRGSQIGLEIDLPTQHWLGPPCHYGLRTPVPASTHQHVFSPGLFSLHTNSYVPNNYGTCLRQYI